MSGVECGLAWRGEWNGVNREWRMEHAVWPGAWRVWTQESEQKGGPWRVEWSVEIGVQSEVESGMQSLLNTGVYSRCVLQIVLHATHAIYAN